MISPDQVRTYDRATSVVFLKTDAPFGGLSNMAGGYPLQIQGVQILTSEALYQACRFPHLPEVQQLIIGQTSPMTAKMKSKPYRKDSRPDWDHARVKVMRWCLRVKLAQNWATFSELLLRTADRPIVAESRKDDFWCAKPVDEQTLVGMNVLGRLLMELREAVKASGHEAFMHVEPLGIPDFVLFGRPIEAIAWRSVAGVEPVAARGSKAPGEDLPSGAAEQVSLFDQPTTREAPSPVYAAVQSGSSGAAHLKPYPAMQDSDVPWLGEVPERWEVRRGKWLFRHRKEINVDRASTNVLSLTLRGVVSNDPDNPEGLVPKDYATYQQFNKGDLVFKLIDLENLRTSRVGLVHEDGIMSSAYVRLVPRSACEIRFFFQQYFDLYQRGVYNQLGAGVRSTLGPNDLLNLSVVVPPLPEQAAIVRFLDHADRRIRRHIRAKQKLIKLLEEQKQAIIHRAVTRGLHPSVRVKPSGVEWLGQVPEHWEVKRCRYLFREVDRRSADGSEEHLSMSQRLGLVPSRLVENRTLVSDSYAGGKLCQVGDLVLNRLKAHLGVFALSKYAGVISPDYTVLRHIEQGSAEYYERVLRSPACRIELRTRAKGIVEGFWRLYTDDFYDIRLPVPPPEERDAIVEYTRKATAEIDTGVSLAGREISLLREYRTRLISDVVSGKLDVREAAARLPRETEELEPLGEGETVDDVDEEVVGELDAAPEEADA